MVFIPIRKLSNESNEEMLTKEHAHGHTGTLYIDQGLTSDLDEISQRKNHN